MEQDDGAQGRAAGNLRLRCKREREMLKESAGGDRHE